MAHTKLPVKGYKVFELYKGSLKCRGHIFGTKKTVVGTTHVVNGTIELCNNGFHFCPKLNDCFRYYSNVNSNLTKHVVCEVEGHLDTVTSSSEDKVATKKLVIKKILTLKEVETILLSDAKLGTTTDKVPTACKIYSNAPHYTASGRRSYFIVVNGTNIAVPRCYQSIANIGLEVDVIITKTVVSNIGTVFSSRGNHTKTTYTAKFL